MASLQTHIHTPHAEEHARLGFRADCRTCRELRLAGTLPPAEVVPRRAKAGIAAALASASTLGPAATAAAQSGPPGGSDIGSEVLPPGGVGEDPAEDVVEPPPSPTSPAPPTEVPVDPPPAAPAPEVLPPGDSASEPRQSGLGEEAATQPAPESSPVQEPAPTPPSAPLAGGDPVGSSGGETGAGTPPSEPAGGEAGGSAPDSGETDAPSGASRGTETGPGRDDSRSGAAGDGRPVLGEGSGGDRPKPAGSNAPAGGGDERPGGHPPSAADTYTVAPGDSLWLIAERLLGRGASEADVATKVSELWELNDTEVIRTGDPDLIYPGQELRLG